VLDAFNGKVDSIPSRVKSDNAGKLEQEIRDAFAIVNLGGEAFRNARITDEYLSARLEELKWGAVAQELKRQEQEEQRRIREQIREEERAQREFERAMREAAKEEDVIKRAMAKAQEQIEKANAEQRVKYELQLQELSIKLQAAEEKNQRALSMAQQTRRGHVYIISNVGSLGENVYKIGLTRRLDPLDRIYELGDSSVPFEFDVHALIMSEDAPALEHQLHKHFVLNQVNKVNHRKEFFRANLTDIRREIEGLGMNAHWTMLAEAREYRETLAIEKLIESDPVARESWLNRQLTLEPAGAKGLLAEAIEEQ
jgi:flagellar biosynthesis GTPase FlhF